MKTHAFDKKPWNKHWKNIWKTLKTLKTLKNIELFFWIWGWVWLIPLNSQIYVGISQIYVGLLRFTLEFSGLRWNFQIYVEFLSILLICYVSLCCSMVSNVLNVFVALCFNVCWWLNGCRCLLFLQMFIIIFNMVQYVSIWFYGLMLSVGFNDFWWSQMVLDCCACCFWMCLMIVEGCCMLLPMLCVCLLYLIVVCMCLLCLVNVRLCSLMVQLCLMLFAIMFDVLL